MQRCLARAVVLLMLTVICCWLTHLPVRQFFVCLSLGFTLTGALAAIAALCRREPLGRASLNGWDEALGLTGLAILARLVERLAG
jgi:hypothetical protein